MIIHDMCEIGSWSTHSKPGMKTTTTNSGTYRVECCGKSGDDVLDVPHTTEPGVDIDVALDLTSPPPSLAVSSPSPAPWLRLDMAGPDCLFLCVGLRCLNTVTSLSPSCCCQCAVRPRRKRATQRGQQRDAPSSFKYRETSPCFSLLHPPQQQTGHACEKMTDDFFIVSGF